MAIIGNNDVTDRSGQTTTAPPNQMINDTHTLVCPANQQITEFHYYSYGTTYSAGQTMNLAVYDITDGANGAPLVTSTTVTYDGTTAAVYSVTGLSVDISAYSGRTLAIAVSRGTGTARVAWVDTTGHPRSSTTGNTFDDPFVQNDTGAGSYYGIWAVTEDAAPASTTINVDIPLHINLKWDTTHQLAVTHDGGTTTLEGVTLSTPTGWETVTYSGSLPTGDSFASLAATDATLGGGGYTMQTGDILAWETQTGLTVDVNTTPVENPAATVSGAYKIWNEAGSTWTSVSSFTVNDLGEVGAGGIPQEGRETYQTIAVYLVTQGFTGANNEIIVNWLLGEGIPRSTFNQMFSEYLAGLGFNGPLPKQMRDWRNE